VERTFIHTQRKVTEQKSIFDSQRDTLHEECRRSQAIHNTPLVRSHRLLGVVSRDVARRAAGHISLILRVELRLLAQPTRMVVRDRTRAIPLRSPLFLLGPSVLTDVLASARPIDQFWVVALGGLALVDEWVRHVKRRKFTVRAVHASRLFEPTHVQRVRVGPS